MLVNNAGIMPLGAFAEEDEATARRLVDINVHGVLHGMKEALPRMRARGRGHIVNIASTAGKVGFAGGATYSGTKHFVVGVSESVRAELRGSAIEITCVMPGVVNTELSAGTPQARFVPHIDPPLVADAIVGALRSPRFEVFVPRRIAPLTKLGAVVPTVVRDGFARLLALDRVLGGADAEARRAYEQRASRSAGEDPSGERWGVSNTSRSARVIRHTPYSQTTSSSSPKYSASRCASRSAPARTASSTGANGSIVTPRTPPLRSWLQTPAIRPSTSSTGDSQP